MDLLYAPVKVAGMFDEAVIFPISKAIDFQAEFIRLYVLFIATIPLGWLMHYLIHGRTIRHLFCILTGIMM